MRAHLDGLEGNMRSNTAAGKTFQWREGGPEKKYKPHINPGKRDMFHSLALGILNQV